jgi:histidinol dehydrogenase
MLYMLAVPAKIAGVKNIYITTPCNQDGTVDPACLYAAKKLEIFNVYRVGGAQAVAAFTFGTSSVPKADKIIGPGSMYVAAAKRLLSQYIDTGLPAGPSESIIIADGSVEPKKTALDLLVEAEHGSDSAAVLLTPDEKTAKAVTELISDFIGLLPPDRKKYVTDVLSNYGGVILTKNIEEAAEISNEFAPEHLLIHSKNPEKILELIHNAGEVLLGEHLPFSGANYSAGPNAVLPTGGKAKTFSAVSVRDFIKFISVIKTDKAAYETLKPNVTALAAYEGFPAHENAFKLRD